MACTVMAYIVMSYVVMAYMIMAYRDAEVRPELDRRAHAPAFARTCARTRAGAHALAHARSAQDPVHTHTLARRAPGVYYLLQSLMIIILQGARSVLPAAE